MDASGDLAPQARPRLTEINTRPAWAIQRRRRLRTTLIAPDPVIAFWPVPGR